MNRIESLELDKQDLINKGENLSDRSPRNGNNDLAGLDDDSNPR